MKFNELKIKEEIVKAIDDMGFVNLTPIQESVIPTILDKKDVIGQAQTGTGKTAAFGIPVIENSTVGNTHVEHIIISPTRELATQIKDELALISKYLKLKLGIVLGGVDYNKEYRMIKTIPNIIVATPGRLLDHLKNNKLDISKVKSLTLDEADEMLNIGFEKEINAIIDYMPETRQSLLFSATLSKEVLALANKFLKNPVEFLVSSGLAATKNVKQFAVVCSESEKFASLVRLIQVEKPRSGVIFGRTKRRTDELAAALNKCGIKAKALHGDMSQNERSKTMQGFRENDFNFLVATDVAARGIHVDGIEVVYNFDLPQEVEYYVHRIGRTGRAGTEGKSYSFLRRNELEHLYLIEQKANSKIKIIDAPSVSEVKKAKSDHVIEMIKETLDSGKAFRNYDNAKRIIEEIGDINALAAALELLTPKVDVDNIKLTSEPPVRVKTPKRNDKGSRGRRDGNRHGFDSKHFSSNSGGNFGGNKNKKNNKFGDNKPKSSGNKSFRKNIKE